MTPEVVAPAPTVVQIPDLDKLAAAAAASALAIEANLIAGKPAEGEAGTKGQEAGAESADAEKEARRQA